MAIYLKIPSMEGLVTTKGYEQCIEVTSYQLNKHRAINQKAGSLSNRTLGLVSNKGLTMTKPLDSASVALAQAFYDAKTIPKIELYHVTTGNEPKCYLKNTYYDVLLTQHEEFHDEESAEEMFQLHFSKTEKKVTPLDQTQNSTSPQIVAFDLETSTLT